jgi:hypothetical protein
MPNLNRVRVNWTNFPGAPGVSTFYLDPTTTNMAHLKTFFNSIKDVFPNGLTTEVPNSGDVIDSATNHIVGGWIGSGGGTQTSIAGANAYSGTSGGLVRWQTNAILNGRRLAGRTYLVPLERAQYDLNGSLAASFITLVGTAAATLIAAYAGSLVMYGPPRNAGTLGPTDPGKAAITGPVISAVIPDLAAVMRSRRL